ncbi:DUF4142 domain-containing protein [Hymenobacter canadensis]|uniref:DUF4142 domain-containing protein n=1 Tax=Hymenobacter canadensis TaxID=2999067 RepID=A0ABY7LW73_9BACT|nr:DUF4142 domain-containing protein [Hymenobacter canadensis]WBA44144.1 DUF4142 domain-containing protein [Hymenobacter canadensis]
MKFVLTAALLGSFSLAGLAPAHAQDKPLKEANKINKQRNKLKADDSPLRKSELNYDSEFVVAVASHHQLEVALGRLAQQKAIAPEVLDWGRQMEATHEQAQRELQAIAERNHITLPTALSEDDRDLYNDVDDRKYLGFDKKYLRALKDQHARTLKQYSEAATKLSTPELQEYAARMLPMLRQDEQTIDALYERADARK